MSDTPEKPVPAEPEQTIACEVCLKEVPTTEVHTMEAVDYVHHFCGLDCLDQWHKKAEQEGEASSD